MIKINLLLKTWNECEYDKNDVEQEVERLYNGMWALHENGLITLEVLKTNIAKLNKAQDKFENQ